MRPVFLSYHHPSGELKYASLESANEPIFFLPNNVEDAIVLNTTVPSSKKDYAQVELLSGTPFLSIYGKEIGQLLLEGTTINIPASTAASQKSVLLRDGDHFETCAGRWSIQRDDEQGAIQNSMRPPPLPQLSSEIKLEPLATAEKQEQHLVKEAAVVAAKKDDAFIEEVPSSKEMNTERPEVELGRARALCQPTTPLKQHLGNTLRSPGEGPSTVGSDARKISTGEPITPSIPAQVGESNDSSLTADTELESIPPIRNRRSAGQERTGQATVTDNQTAKRRKIDQVAVGFDKDASNPHIEKNIVVTATSVQQKQQPSPRTRQSNRKSRHITESEEKVQPASPSPVTSSMHLARSHRSVSPTETEKRKEAPIVYFASNTTIDARKNTMNTFFGLGGKKARFIGEANILCVGDELKKTGTLLLAIAQGVDIVTENWIVETHRNKAFPQTSTFVPKDTESERHWGFKLQDAIGRGKEGLAHLLTGITIYTTAQFKKDLGTVRARDISSIATALGAEVIKPQLPKKVLSAPALAIGVANDPEAARVGKLGLKLYDKELLTMAVLRGVVDLESEEFAIEAPVKNENSSQ